MFASRLIGFLQKMQKTDKNSHYWEKNESIVYVQNIFFIFFLNEGVFTQKLNVRLMSWTISNTKKYIIKKNRPHLQKRFYFRNQNEKRKSKLTAKITPGVSVQPWNQSHAEEWHSHLWNQCLYLDVQCTATSIQQILVHKQKHSSAMKSAIKRLLDYCKQSPWNALIFLKAEV